MHTHTGYYDRRKDIDKNSIHLLFKLPNGRSKFTYHSHWYNLNWVPIFPISKKGFFIYWDRVVFTVTRRCIWCIMMYVFTSVVSKFTYQLQCHVSEWSWYLSTYAWHINKIKFVWSHYFLELSKGNFKVWIVMIRQKGTHRRYILTFGHQVYTKKKTFFLGGYR